MGYKSKIAFVFTASLLSMSSFAACFGYASVGGDGSKNLPTTLCK